MYLHTYIHSYIRVSVHHHLCRRLFGQHGVVVVVVNLLSVRRQQQLYTLVPRHITWHICRYFSRFHRLTLHMQPDKYECSHPYTRTHIHTYVRAHAIVEAARRVYSSLGAMCMALRVADNWTACMASLITNLYTHSWQMAEAISDAREATHEDGNLIFIYRKLLSLFLVLNLDFSLT